MGLQQAPTKHVGRLTNHDLRDAADRLVAARRDLPAGSVLRTFSRSVRVALLEGVPLAKVVPEAERRAGELLAQRPAGHDHPRPRDRSRAGAPVPPRPRRARTRT